MADLMKKVAYFGGGQNLSSVVDLGESATFVGILMPAGWTTAAATFQACDTEDGTFKNVYNAAGTELSLVTNAANRAYQTVSGLECFRFIKIRSGSAATPVTQVGAQEVIFLIKEG